MIEQTTKKMGRRSFIYTRTTEPEKFQIQDEEGITYEDAFDVVPKVYVEVERQKEKNEE